MVVSCKTWFTFCFSLCLVVFCLNTCQAEVRPLTDEEMDEIVAANLPYEVLDSALSDEIGVNVQQLVDQVTAIIEPLLNQGETGGNALININAILSEVLVQSNFSFTVGSESYSIIQSNQISP